MPFYDYECDQCGPFTALRPMAECADPLFCLDCGASSARVFLRAPAIACSDAGTRKAVALNERSRPEPKLASKHRAGCGCCTVLKAPNHGRREPLRPQRASRRPVPG